MHHKLQEDKRDLQASLETAASQLKDQVASLGTNYITASSREHERSRLHILRGNKEVIGAISTEIGNKLATLRLNTSKSGREIRFIGSDRDALLSTLLVLRPAMRWAILHLLQHHQRLVSEERVQFLVAEFDKLVASASQEVAASHEGSTANSFDDWNYGPGRYPHFSEKLNAPADAPRSNDFSPDHSNLKRKISFEQTPAKRLKPSSNTFKFSTPVGELQIHLGRANSLTNATYHDICNVGFSFSPEAKVCSAWLAAQFTKVIGVESKPRLYTQLVMFNSISDERHSDFTDLMFHGSIQDFDKAFEAGLVSAYDAHPDHPEESILFHVSSSRTSTQAFD